MLKSCADSRQLIAGILPHNDYIYHILRLFSTPDLLILYPAKAINTCGRVQIQATAAAPISCSYKMARLEISG